MTTIRTTIRNGRFDLRAPDELPEGSEVLVEVTAIPRAKIGITESEWRDDPVALAEWDAWLKTLEPIELEPKEQIAHDRFNDEFRKFNIEAVRDQMREGSAE